MTFNPLLSQGQVINNDQLCETFGCSPQGGMRRSLKTNTLVLISNHVESIYDDRWIDGVFHYTGMGQKGDQSLDFSQNKTLSESTKNEIEVYLFEVDKEKEYTYQGKVHLAGTPYKRSKRIKMGRIDLFSFFLCHYKRVYQHLFQLASSASRNTQGIKRLCGSLMSNYV